MRFFQKLTLAATLFVTAQSQAFTPESGFWWNPNEGGSGYAFEIQDNYLFVATYVYDEGGIPIWYTAGGTMGGVRFFDGSLNYTYNGTCIDCNVTQPITLLGERGPIHIVFDTETTGTIQFQGVVKNIERFNFLLGDETDRMLGEWQTVIDFSVTGSDFPFLGDIMVFDNSFLVNGDKFVEGCRPENSIDGFCTDLAFNNNYVDAVFDFENNELLVTVDDGQLNGVDYVFEYYLKIGLNQFDGEVEYYPKNGSHNNVFYPVRGFRTGSRTFVETGDGPSKIASVENKDAKSMLSNLNVELPTKKLSEYSEEKKTKILNQRKIFKIIHEMERKR